MNSWAGMFAPRGESFIVLQRTTICALADKIIQSLADRVYGCSPQKPRQTRDVLGLL
jgi:hypothetical protein